MNSSAIERLLSIMQTLRDPARGCPWDKQQTFTSLLPYTLEETYEVIDAVQRQDQADLCSELGDLLFQIVFYAQLGKEAGQFDFEQVCQAISDKLEKRHPHVFADVDRETYLAEPSAWEKGKAGERAAKAQYFLLDDIPIAQPALMRAQKIQQRCASVGFDWADYRPVLAKVQEEIAEVLAEIEKEPSDQQKLAEELGDLLFAVVNLTRHLGFKAEMILQQANQKFIRRFNQVEETVIATGKQLRDSTQDEMEEIWQRVKRREKM